MTESKEISKWSDSFMFTAEPSDNTKPPKAYLLGASVDPLGQIAACAKMYKGQMVTDLATVTDEERMEYLIEIQKTALKMPLESVQLHFMLDNVHRGITHQQVRQRTAAFAQESTRFAVKEDMAKAVAYPPSLEGTLSRDEVIQLGKQKMADAGVNGEYMDLDEVLEWSGLKSKEQTWRNVWDGAVETVSAAYEFLVNDGMPAEDARGLAPTNLLTRLNYITNLRNFYDTMAVRVSDQAQFEWRQVAMAYALAMREFGQKAEYPVWVSEDEFRSMSTNDYLEVLIHDGFANKVKIVKSSAWQYEALMKEIKPIEFRVGGPAFGANFDRPSRIGERVRAFHAKGVPSSRWTEGAPEHNIPPIHPEEWLLDPKAARLDANEEFDIYGNRVPKGTGAHWFDGHILKEPLS
ncbi:ThyX-like thymidylate synthase [Arthrobacter phage Wollypog]|uniref:ThyX-like thymidylate synthetase n=1 Tax=Arthrobacter phage Wollypog TaxID=2790985 RepID=A0A7T3KD71_9CAUD|nr:thymidylate synthase [Arthrobacter phage Wollypog]QPX62615.1 ThyX-like thymidylate synthase [Arthrobacter phage Wollypog]